MLRAENARRERGERDEQIVCQGGVVDTEVTDMKNGIFESVDKAKAAKGDEWSGFRYSL